jgi:hypothetical protein
MLHHGSAAAAEFQKSLDHRAVLANFPTSSLAHLGRAYALPGDTTKATATYQDFLTLWTEGSGSTLTLTLLFSSLRKRSTRSGDNCLNCSKSFCRFG